MTDQELFDKVVTHLRTQGKQSTGSHGGCMYRNAEGLTCAAGCLIPEEFDTAGIEGLPLATILKWHPNLFGEGINMRLLRMFQNLHDYYFGSLEARAQEIAITFQLNYTPPTPTP